MLEDIMVSFQYQVQLIDIFVNIIPPRIKVFSCTCLEILVSRYQASEGGRALLFSLTKHVHFVIYVIMMLFGHMDNPHEESIYRYLGGQYSQ